MRIFIVPVMALLFIGWVLYRWLIKKDIKQHKGDVIGGFMFIAIWVVIYVCAWL